ncbi:hypothetical protein [Zoogloea sp. LCSB751]|nr:hypothetical protein [Zoogloea sp. LCSB751]
MDSADSLDADAQVSVHPICHWKVWAMKSLKLAMSPTPALMATAPAAR